MLIVWCGFYADSKSITVCIIVFQLFIMAWALGKSRSEVWRALIWWLFDPINKLYYFLRLNNYCYRKNVCLSSKADTKYINIHWISTDINKNVTIIFLTLNTQIKGYYNYPTHFNLRLKVIIAYNLNFTFILVI